MLCVLGLRAALNRGRLPGPEGSIMRPLMARRARAAAGLALAIECS
ncbi:hypothetical protein [Thermomonospora curvata]|nr:hypothetical protein [Thermomonospora curvata]